MTLLRRIAVYIAHSFLVVIYRNDSHCPVRQRDEFLKGIVLMVEVRFDDDHGILIDHAGDDSGMVEIGRREDGSWRRRFRERPTLILQMEICIIGSILSFPPESGIEAVVLIE